MYKLSYERCVCFIFLVIVAILSCSGFRIDSLAMTDISKRNPPHTSSSSSSSSYYYDSIKPFSSSRNFQDFFTSDLENARNLELIPIRHLGKRHAERRQRIRHFRHTMKSPNERTNAATTIHPSTSEQLAQIPPSDIGRPVPTSAISATTQRPSKSRKKCQVLDVARKAYLADAVVLAKVNSRSRNETNHTYGVSFEIIEWLKKPTTGLTVNNIRLTFSSGGSICETDNPEQRIKVNIQPSKEYYLFLKAHDEHNFVSYGSPVQKSKNRLQRISRVLKPNFVPKLPQLQTNISLVDRKLKLTCKGKGFPVPVLSWRKNGVTLRSNNRTRITYKGRKTTLIIKNPQYTDYNSYECVATDLKNQEVTKKIPFSKYGELCKDGFSTDYCSNGGICHHIVSLKMNFCVCPTGFQGEKCELKTVSGQTNRKIHQKL